MPLSCRQRSNRFLLTCATAYSALCGVYAAALEPTGTAITSQGEELQVLQTISGHRYVQLGDIYVPVEQSLDSSIRLAPDALLAPVSQWPGGVVYLEFDESVSTSQQNIFLQTVQQWSDASAVLFGQHTASNPYSSNYILVQNGGSNGGSSQVGYGGVPAQPMTLNRWDSVAILHEIGHALGLYHEQQRSDRDTYITINDVNNLQGNCPSVWTANYGAKPGTLVTNYDFASVMHYPGYSGLYCGPDLDVVNISAILPEPVGPPSGSEDVCTTTSACNQIMGTGVAGNLSERDKYGMAQIYGFRLVGMPTDGNGTGSVSVSGNIDSCGATCFRAGYGGTVTIHAAASANSLAYISGACSGRSICSTTMLSNQTFHVRFLLRKTVVGLVTARSSTDPIFANGFEKPSTH
jgi:hypothetical protein